MAMTTQEKKNLRNYCAYLLKEYGILISPDDPVIPALYIFYRHTNSLHESNQALVSQVQSVLSKVRPKEFHFHHPGEAWKFQLAAAVKWAIGGLVVIILSVLGIWQWSRSNDVEAANTVLQSAGNMSILFDRIRRNESGIYYLDFTAASGDSVRYFSEYQRLNKKTVRIYMGSDSSNIKAH